MSVVDGKRRSRRRVLPTGSPQMLQNGVTAAARGPRSLAEAPAPAAARPADALPGRSAPAGWLSKSAAKTPIEPERAKRNVDIPRFCSPPIPARSAFVADLDTPRPEPSHQPHQHHPEPGYTQNNLHCQGGTVSMHLQVRGAP